jgi:hypothetical protein
VRSPLFQPLADLAHLQVDDLLHVLDGQGVEDDDFVDPVQELGPECLFQSPSSILVPGSRALRRHRLAGTQEAQGAALLGVLGADVGGHDDHGVAEIDDAALTVGQRPSSRICKEGIPHVRMGLFDLVKETIW